MRQGIGSVFLYNIIIVFIIITFAFIAGIMSYSKAFKVNSRIANALENNEGYNELSNKEINRVLGDLGYISDSRASSTCPRKNGKTAITAYNKNWKYCIYEYDKDEKGYFRYGIITYIRMDIPIIGNTLMLPVYSETERIYEFSKIR